MKPCTRILVGYKNSSFLARCHHSLTLSNPFSLSLDHIHKYSSIHHCPFRLLMHNGNNHKVFGLPSSSFGQSKVTTTSNKGRTKGDDVSDIIGGVAFKAREFSSFVETRVNDNNVERVYVKGGMNVKPLVVERVDEYENNVEGEEEGSRLEGDEEDVNTENNNSGDLKNVSEAQNIGDEETEVEKEAWKLLKEALVTYDNYPVGTVAANDSGCKQQPLNYDQVFIRDFIPSALAFLLKGEKEIVKNFLLNTLQLQVIYSSGVNAKYTNAKITS